MIDHLKEAIHKKRGLPITNAHQLQLCITDIPDTERAREKFAFKNGEVLRRTDILWDKVFKGKLPKKKHIHIAVKRPGK